MFSTYLGGSGPSGQQYPLATMAPASPSCGKSFVTERVSAILYVSDTDENDSAFAKVGLLYGSTYTLLTQNRRIADSLTL